MAVLLTRNAQIALASFLHSILITLLGLHLYVTILPARSSPIPLPADPESAWWGFWPVTSIPAPLLLLATLLLLTLTLVCQVRLRRDEVASRVNALPWMVILTFTSLLLLLGFFLFPIVHTRWGDAYILANGVSWPDPELRLTRSWQAPLDLFLHSQVWHWLGARFGWSDAAPVYRLLSPLAGALYLAGALWVSRDRLFAAFPWLAFGLLVTTAVIQLFFGYIENYSFVAATILLYLVAGLKRIRSGEPLWPVSTLLALGIAFHPSALVYLPSLLYLTLQRLRTGAQRIPTLLSTGVPLILGALLVLGIMESGGHGLGALFGEDRPGGGDGRWFVPLFQTATRWEHYTLFSPLHLRELINQQILTAPMVLPSLLILLLFRATATDRSAKSFGDEPVAFVQGNFLMIAAVSHLALIVFWNPDYGGQRDWDLFSLASIPLTLLLIWALPRFIAPARLAATVTPLILFQALHTAAWIYQNRLPWEWPS